MECNEKQIGSYSFRRAGKSRWLIERLVRPRFVASIVEPLPGAFLESRLLWWEEGHLRDKELEEESVSLFLAYLGRNSTNAVNS